MCVLKNVVRIMLFFFRVSPLYFLTTRAVKTVKWKCFVVYRFLCVGTTGYPLAEQCTRTGLGQDI